MKKVVISAAMLCEDVRREDNGKALAIGIFGNRIFVSSFPSVLRLASLLNVSFTETGHHTFKIRLSVGTEMVSEMTINAEIVWPGLDWLPLRFEPVLFNERSEITLSLELENGKWKKFFSMPVEIPPTA